MQLRHGQETGEQLAMEGGTAVVIVSLLSAWRSQDSGHPNQSVQQSGRLFHIGLTKGYK